MKDLSSYNSFGLHVAASELKIIRAAEELEKIDFAHSLILGRGSDVLFTDDFEGTVLINEIRFLNIEDTGTDCLIRAGSGMILDELIATLTASGICGLENLSGIPGTVGAAPIQNAGAYGVEIGSFITKVEAWDCDAHRMETFSAGDCAFGYRSSFFKTHKERRLFITAVELRLSRKFRPVLSYRGLDKPVPQNPLELRQRILKMRASKLPDPALIGNAGSFFENPVVDREVARRLKYMYPDMPVYAAGLDERKSKLAAAWLIDKAGCRGITHGNAGTWEHQALVIVNRGLARPNEIVALAKYIQYEVKNLFGIHLIPEVRIYGKHGEISWDSL